MHKLIAILLATLCLSACGKPADTFDWKEEIQLHDGRKIVAQRLDVLGGWAEPGQERAPKERSITFSDPDNPAKTYTHTITGSSNYLLLDFENGVPWLIVYVGPFSTDTKCPNDTYDTYRWNGAGWQQMAFKNLPKKFTGPNLTDAYSDETRVKGKLTTAIQIRGEIERSKREFATEAIWRFVEKIGNGRPIDCQDYLLK
jgi:hypothetical protein